MLGTSSHRRGSSFGLGVSNICITPRLSGIVHPDCGRGHEHAVEVLGRWAAGTSNANATATAVAPTSAPHTPQTGAGMHGPVSTRLLPTSPTAASRASVTATRPSRFALAARDPASPLLSPVVASAVSDDASEREDHVDDAATSLLMESSYQKGHAHGQADRPGSHHDGAGVYDDIESYHQRPHRDDIHVVTRPAAVSDEEGATIGYVAVDVDVDVDVDKEEAKQTSLIAALILWVRVLITI